MVTGYWLIGQHVRRNVSLMVYTYVVYGASSVTLFVYNAFNGASFTDYAAKDWWIFLALAVIPTLLGHTVFDGPSSGSGPLWYSVSILGEPIGASVLAYVVFGETLSTSQWMTASRCEVASSRMRIGASFRKARAMRDPLALAAAEARAAFADRQVEAFGQGGAPARTARRA